MLLNSKYSNFLFQFPRNFFPAAILEKYTSFVKRIQSGPFDDVSSYINWTVQSVSWPEIQTTTVEQGDRDDFKTYIGGWEPFHYTTREFDVTFKTTEGYLNYFILLDLLLDYWGDDNKETRKVFLPDLMLSLLDSRGYLLVTYKFTDVVYSGLSALELSYASNVPEYKQFSANFKYRRFDIIRQYD